MNAPNMPSVCLLGLGIMGSAMGSNLVRAGFRPGGYDIQPDAINRFESAGGSPFSSIAEAAAASEIIITSLPTVVALYDVVAALEVAVRPGMILVETSTFPLADKVAAQVRLNAIGVTMLDCPLSGTGEQAKTRDLLVYGSGPRDAYDRCILVFGGFARAAHYLGEFGNGSKMKYVANLLVAIHTAAAGEAFAIARMAGLDPAEMFAVIADGAGGSNSLRARGAMLVADSYTPVRTMPLSLWQKDLRIITEFAESLACPTPMFSAALPLFNAAVAAGYGDQDTAAVAAVFRNLERPSATDR